MSKNFKSGIVASVIAVTIATAGITTVSSFTFVPEAQAWSLKSAAKKTLKYGKTHVKNARDLHDIIVPSELRYPTRKVKKVVNKIIKWRPKPVTTGSNAPVSHDHRTKSFSKVTVKRR